MQFADVGFAIHYQLDGPSDGFPLVFIHALGCDLRIWDDVIPYFARDFRIIRYDLRGHGLSDCPPAPYSLDDEAHDLKRLLAHLKVKTAILVGISVGGMIAMTFARQTPEQVKALVLCDTNTTIGTTAMWNQRIETLRRDGMVSMGQAILARWFASTFAEKYPAAHRGYYNMLTRASVTGYTATCEAIRDADLIETAKNITSKTLVVCGAEDISIPLTMSQELAAIIPQARFAIVEGAGHLPCVEQPDQFAALISPFLQEIYDV